jgi:hypothetical protein
MLDCVSLCLSFDKEKIKAYNIDRVERYGKYLKNKIDNTSDAIDFRIS